MSSAQSVQSQKRSIDDLTPPLVGSILKYRWPYKLAIVGCSFLSTVLFLLAPYFQKIFVDHQLGYSRTELVPVELWSLSSLAVLVLAFFLTAGGLGLAQLTGWLAFRESSEVQRVLSDTLYRKMMMLRTGDIGGRHTGEVISLFAIDVPGATVFVEQTLPSGVSIFFPLILAPATVHLLFGVPLTPIFWALLVVVAVNFLLSYRQALFFLKFKQLAAERTGLINEWAQNLRILRVLGWVEKFEDRIFTKRIQETRNRVEMVTNGQIMSSFASSISFLANCVGVYVLLQVKGEAVSPGELLALLWIFGVLLARAFRALPWFFTFGMDSLTSLGRIEEFLKIPTPTPEQEFFAKRATQEIRLTDAEGLDIEGLSLHYNQVPILRDVSLSAKPGEFIAIVGAVGSGKSQILLSLLGETSATYRKFRIQNQPVSAWSLTERRRHFNFVPQEGFVMSATLRDNVAFEYESPSSQDREVLESLTLAQFGLEEERIPKGLETVIGERGVNLSGGQRQRVSLARAEYFDRPIFLLDDSLSALDVDTENKIVSELLIGAWRNKTRILVTHRLSILKKVDRVYFLKDGAVLAVGTYQELVEKSPEFAEFAKSVSVDEAMV